MLYVLLTSSTRTGPTRTQVERNKFFKLYKILMFFLVYSVFTKCSKKLLVKSFSTNNFAKKLSNNLKPTFHRNVQCLMTFICQKIGCTQTFFLLFLRYAVDKRRYGNLWYGPYNFLVIYLHKLKSMRLSQTH